MMQADVNLRHVEEESQKRDIVAMAALLATGTPNISEVMRRLETALQAAYERGFKCGRNHALPTPENRPQPRGDKRKQAVNQILRAMAADLPQPNESDKPPASCESNDVVHS